MISSKIGSKRSVISALSNEDIEFCTFKLYTLCIDS